MALRDNTFRDYWRKRKGYLERARSEGRCIVTFGHQRRFQVSCPENAEFIAGAKSLKGRFRPRTKTWTFYSWQSSPVITLCNKVFGHERVAVHGPRPVHRCPHYIERPCGPAIQGFRQCDCEGCVRCPKRIK